MGRRIQEIMNEVPRDRMSKFLELQGCPECGMYTDCFAWSEGRCTALKEAGGKDCVFYKPAKQVQEENQAIYEKLVKNKRYDLLEKYEFAYVNLGIEDPEFSDPEGIYAERRAVAECSGTDDDDAEDNVDAETE